MAEWLRLVVDSLVTWVRFPHGAESFCRAEAILRGSPSVRFLYCCALYNSFFLGFRKWQSRTDRVSTLNINIRLPPF